MGAPPSRLSAGSAAEILLAESPIVDCPAALASLYAPKRSREGRATTSRGVCGQNYTMR